MRRSLCLVCLLLFLSGCGSGGGGGWIPLSVGSGVTRSGSLELRVQWPGVVSKGKLIPASADIIQVTVTGEGLSSPLVQSVTKSQVQNGQVTLSFSNVPIGTKTVEVKALDSSGNLVAHRTTSVSVQENQTATVTTQLGITISDGSFTPSQFTLNKGETLLWVNGGQLNHSVVKASDGSAISPVLAPGGSFSFQADSPEKLNFRCGIHPNETGTFLVNFPPPILASLSPSSGPSGSSLTINGSNFGILPTGNSVTIAGISAPVVSWSDTQVMCIVPSGTGVTDGSVKVTVAGVGSNTLNLVVTPREEWTSTYNGPANGYDPGFGITVDSTGNVYVTGSENRSDLGQGQNIWVRKYDPNGNTVWTQTYNGPANGTDEGTDITVDSTGSVYVAGYNSAPGVWNDIWVRKYGPTGGIGWTYTYNSPANNVDVGRGVAADIFGNVYVTGYELRQDIGQDYDIRLLKVAALPGSPIWNQTYNDFQNRQDQGFGVAVNASGFVWVTGSENILGESDNIWVRKYDPSGNTRWTKTYNDPASGQDVGFEIAVDSSDNAYVAGVETIPGEGQNVWVRKYDTNGNDLWTRTYNGPASGNDGGYGISVDGFGNVYVAGAVSRTDLGQGLNILVLKYDPSGNILWTETYNSPANSDDSGADIHVDSSGNLYIVGYETRPDLGQGQNIWVRKYRQ